MTVTDGAGRRDALEQVEVEARACARCAQLVQSRRNVVFGSGDPNADLVFVGEAPGRAEDESGRPFAGRAGELLDELLAGIGLGREDVFLTNVLMCMPPGNRDPHPNEVARCQEWLWRKLELVRPTLVCTLGNFTTRLLCADQAPITWVHGRVQTQTLGTLTVRLLPLFHPAAALYTPANVDLLRRDMEQIPGLLALGPLAQTPPLTTAPPPESPPESPAEVSRRPAERQPSLF